MRVPAVSFAKRIAVAVAVGLLALGLALPHAPAFAEGEDAPSALLASSLMDGSASVVREDVALAAPEDDAVPEPIIGSFTVDGLTFAVTEGSNVQLVGVSPSWQQATGLQVGEGSSQPSMPALRAEGPDADSSALLIPESVSYNNVEYVVSSIGAYAFYLSGVTSVELPASIVDVDDCAFRSSDVASVEVAEGNTVYSSFDGALYDAGQLSLLLIPEGKQGTVLLPKTAESAAPSVFSHCPLVTQVSVEEGSAAFASENGLLYDASLTTLLRVPAGATEITIREGCTTIAAGAMEACASLATINAPASVTSISPYLFEQQPETVMAPVAVSAVEDDGGDGPADEGEPAEAAPQLSAMVALSSTDNGLPAVDVSAINLVLPVEASTQPWQVSGFVTEGNGDGEIASETAEASPAIIAQDVSLVETDSPIASLGEATMYGALKEFYLLKDSTMTFYPGLGYREMSIRTKDKINLSSFGGTGNDYYYPYSEGVTTGSFALKANNQNLLLGMNTNSSGQGLASSWLPFGETIYKNGSLVYTVGSKTKLNGMPELMNLVFTKRGYSFSNWRIGSEDGSVFDPSTYNGGSINLYATYIANEYAVSFDPNKGSGGQSTDVRATYDSDMPSISSIKPKRDGYTFMGWYDDPDYTKAQSTQYYTAAGISSRKWDKAGEAKLFAGWKKNPVYTITLKKNIGNDITSEYGKVYLWYDKGWYATANPEDDTTPLSRLDISLSWAGRTCKGFSKDKNAGTAAYWTDLSTLPSVRAFSSSQSLYAVWETNPVYKVTINSEHGTGGTSEIYLWYGKGWYSESNPTDSSTAISSITFPSYPGYSPTGCWDSLTSSNRNRYVDADGSITAGVEAVDKGTTWHVGWSKKDSYKIALNKNGGSADLTRYYWPDKGYTTSAGSTSVVAKGSVLVDPVDLPTLTGWSFTGYYSGRSGGTCYIDSAGKLTDKAPAITDSDGTTWYAQWSRNSYTVTFEVEDDAKLGSIGSSITVRYGASDYCSHGGLPATRPGFTFVGWFDAEGNQAWAGGAAAKGKYWSGDGTSGVWCYPGDVTMYAHWDPLTITTTWNCNGGLFDGKFESAPRYTEYGTGKTLGDALEEGLWEPPRLARPGYTLLGWFTAASGGTQVTAETLLPTVSTAYYAQWKAKTIFIEWNANGGLMDGSFSAIGRNTEYGPGKTLADSLEAGFWKPPRLARPGYTLLGWFTDKTDGEQVFQTTSLPTENSVFYAHWSAASYQVTFAVDHDDMTLGAAGSPITVKTASSSYCSLGTLVPRRSGYIFVGWFDEGGEQAWAGGVAVKGKYWSGDGTSGVWCYPGDVTMYAHWTPAISVDVPIAVTAEVDLLGIEDQVPASGYIESRCGAPLAVEEVSFTVFAGAADLFGEANTASVSLEALALAGDASWDASTPIFSFPLSADATESDASKLAALRMEGYEDHIPIGYRFAIPEDVLASIDPARFEKATTPVCSVVYKVGLVAAEG